MKLVTEIVDEADANQNCFSGSDFYLDYDKFLSPRHIGDLSTDDKLKRINDIFKLAKEEWVALQAEKSIGQICGTQLMIMIIPITTAI